jgi:hypothetical protein
MKLLSLLVLAFVLLSSCQKEKSYETPTGGGPGGGGGNASYFLQAKVNGTVRTFNFNDAAVLNDVGGGSKTLSIIGFASSNTSSLEGVQLAINFTSGGPQVGTYKEDYAGTDYIAAGLYNPNSTTTAYGAGLVAASVSPLSITITKIDSVKIAGTFKGAFYKMDLTTGNTSTTEYLEFTEGQFNLPLQ